jgi:hypothetical protein
VIRAWWFSRTRPEADPSADELGAISASLASMRGGARYEASRTLREMRRLMTLRQRTRHHVYYTADDDSACAGSTICNTTLARISLVDTYARAPALTCGVDRWR